MIEIADRSREKEAPLLLRIEQVQELTNLGRSTIEQTEQDAHFAALQLSQARRNLALSAKGDTVAAKRFEVALNRYVIGRISIDNLYVAQNEKDQALRLVVLWICTPAQHAHRGHRAAADADHEWRR